MRPALQPTLASKYGHKSGLLRLLIGRTYLFAGGYRRYRSVNWNIVQRLVFICQGNICRSAYAEAHAQKLGLGAASAGWQANPGGPAHPDTIRLAAQRNMDLSDHRASRVAQMSFMDGDLLICMEPAHARAIRRLTEKNRQQQVTLLGLWATDRRPFIQDPYGLTDEYWNTCLDSVDSGIHNISVILGNRV